MSIKDCYNIEDFRKLAKKNLPSPIFHYIDGGADDETTLKRNTESFAKCDLIPNILASVGEPDLSVNVFGQKIDMPLFLSPKLPHPDGFRAALGVPVQIHEIGAVTRQKRLTRQDIQAKNKNSHESFLHAKKIPVRVLNMMAPVLIKCTGRL